jgi:hypothetical protein
MRTTYSTPEHSTIPLEPSIPTHARHTSGPQQILILTEAGPAPAVKPDACGARPGLSAGGARRWPYGDPRLREPLIPPFRQAEEGDPSVTAASTRGAARKAWVRGVGCHTSPRKQKVDLIPQELDCMVLLHCSSPISAAFPSPWPSRPPCTILALSHQRNRMVSSQNKIFPIALIRTWGKARRFLRIARPQALPPSGPRPL